MADNDTKWLCILNTEKVSGSRDSWWLTRESKKVKCCTTDESVYLNWLASTSMYDVDLAKNLYSVTCPTSHGLYLFFLLPDSHELLLIQPNWTWAGLSFLKRRYASSSFFHLYFCVYSSKTNSSTGVVTSHPISTMNLLQSRELLQWTMVFCSWFR